MPRQRCCTFWARHLCRTVWSPDVLRVCMCAPPHRCVCESVRVVQRQGCDCSSIVNHSCEAIFPVKRLNVRTASWRIFALFCVFHPQTSLAEQETCYCRSHANAQDYWDAVRHSPALHSARCVFVRMNNCDADLCTVTSTNTNLRVFWHQSLSSNRASFSNPLDKLRRTRGLPALQLPD